MTTPWLCRHLCAKRLLNADALLKLLNDQFDTCTFVDDLYPPDIAEQHIDDLLQCANDAENWALPVSMQVFEQKHFEYDIQTAHVAFNELCILLCSIATRHGLIIPSDFDAQQLTNACGAVTTLLIDKDIFDEKRAAKVCSCFQALQNANNADNSRVDALS